MDQHRIGPIEYDTSLCKIVLHEPADGLTISAAITRFGDLNVMVIKEDHDGSSLLWQGTNIIDARNWARAHRSK